MTGALFVLTYLVGFVIWYRNRYRTYLNNRDRNIAHNLKRSSWTQSGPVNDIATCKFGALSMAVLWPVTVIPWLLSYNVKTDKQHQEMVARKEQELADQRATLKRQAKDLNLPGWERL